MARRRKHLDKVIATLTEIGEQRWIAPNLLLRKVTKTRKFVSGTFFLYTLEMHLSRKDGIKNAQVLASIEVPTTAEFDLNGWMMQQLNYNRNRFLMKKHKTLKPQHLIASKSYKVEIQRKTLDEYIRIIGEGLPEEHRKQYNVPEEVWNGSGLPVADSP